MDDQATQKLKTKSKTIIVTVPEDFNDDIVYKDGEVSIVPKRITNEIKTFNDACKWCSNNGFDPLVRDHDVVNNAGLVLEGALTLPLESYLHNRILACALNEGWKPTYAEDEVRYVLVADYAERTYKCIEEHGTVGHVNYPLTFKSAELAEYLINGLLEKLVVHD